MSNAGRSRIGCLHCQLICLPSVNSHLKNKTEKDCKRERGREEEVEEWSRRAGGRQSVLALLQLREFPIYR